MSRRTPSVATAARLLGRHAFADYARGELRELQAGTYRRKNLAPLDMEMRLHLERLDGMALSGGQPRPMGLLAAGLSAQIRRLRLPPVYARELALCFLVEGAKQLKDRYGLPAAEAARLAHAGAKQRPGAKAA